MLEDPSPEVRRGRVGVCLPPRLFPPARRDVIAFSPILASTSILNPLLYPDTTLPHLPRTLSFFAPPDLAIAAGFSSRKRNHDECVLCFASKICNESYL